MDDQLKQAIADALNASPIELTSEKSLQDFEDWDSVMVLTVMVILGKHLGKEILPEDVTDLRTFGDIEALVASKLS
jgi:acyl carrier protein